MRRLYFMLPSVETTTQMVDELLLKRIDEQHIHVLAREGTSLGSLPEASLLQKSDFIPAVERGLAVGGITGVFAGIAAVTSSASTRDDGLAQIVERGQCAQQGEDPEHDRDDQVVAAQFLVLLSQHENHSGSRPCGTLSISLQHRCRREAVERRRRW